MLVVGLTGGIASGKSTVAELFAELGVPIIDADELSRLAVSKGSAGLALLAEAFGPSLLTNKGELNRTSARKLIFENAEARQRMEAIIHPQVELQMQSLISQYREAGQLYCIAMIPLLFEANMQHLVDRILVVDIDPEIQRSRLKLRDDIDDEQAELIINAQTSAQIRITGAHEVISNNNNQDDLSVKVAELHQLYRTQSKPQN